MKKPESPKHYELIVTKKGDREEKAGQERIQTKGDWHFSAVRGEFFKKRTIEWWGLGGRR